MSGSLKRNLAGLLVFCCLVGGMFSLSSPVALAASPTASCPVKQTILGFPTWYKYLNGQRSADDVTLQEVCQPVLNSISDVWLIVAAVIELLLRLAALIAIGFVVFGGVSYTISQGQPDKTKQALKTIINALIGLAIAIASTALITFIAGRFNQ